MFSKYQGNGDVSSSPAFWLDFLSSHQPLAQVAAATVFPQTTLIDALGLHPRILFFSP